MNIREQYMNYLKIKGYAENTINQYIKEFDEFRGEIEEKNKKELSIEELSVEDVLYYQNFLKNVYIDRKGKHLSNNTVVKRMEQLRTFSVYVQTIDNSKNIFEGVVQDKLIIKNKVVKELTYDEVNKIIETVLDENYFKKKETYYRNKLIVLLMIYEGLKIDEIRELKFNDIDLENNEMIIKGEKRKITDNIKVHFKEWFDFLENEKTFIKLKLERKRNQNLNKTEEYILKSEYIFVSQKEEYIGLQVIHHIVQKLRKDTEIKNLNPKTLNDSTRFFKK